MFKLNLDPAGRDQAIQQLLQLVAHPGYKMLEQYWFHLGSEAAQAFVDHDPCDWKGIAAIQQDMKLLDRLQSSVEELLTMYRGDEIDDEIRAESAGDVDG